MTHKTTREKRKDPNQHRSKEFSSKEPFSAAERRRIQKKLKQNNDAFWKGHDSEIFGSSGGMSYDQYTAYSRGEDPPGDVSLELELFVSKRKGGKK